MLWIPCFWWSDPQQHWALWMDIPVAALGWSNTPALASFPVCCLKCMDPHIVNQYNKYLCKELEHHNLWQHLEALANQVTSCQLTRAQQPELEAIHMASTKAKLTSITCHLSTIVPRIDQGNFPVIVLERDLEMDLQRSHLSPIPSTYG